MVNSLRLGDLQFINLFLDQFNVVAIYLCIYLFIYIDTNNSGLKVPGLYQEKILRQISLPQSPRQETFWALVGFESTEESVTLSD